MATEKAFDRMCVHILDNTDEFILLGSKIYLGRHLYDVVMHSVVFNELTSMSKMYIILDPYKKLNEFGFKPGNDKLKDEDFFGI